MVGIVTFPLGRLGLFSGGKLAVSFRVAVVFVNYPGGLTHTNPPMGIFFMDIPR